MSLRKKRILLLSEGFGAGHTQAAHALAVSLRLCHADIQARVLELGSFLHPTLAPWIFNAYRKTVSNKPNLYAKLYRYQYQKSLNPLTQLALHRIFYRQTDQVIRHLRPDIIVCTHPFPNMVISRLKRAGLSVPLVTVITDYDAHGTWVNPEVDRYLVSTASVKSTLLKRGVSVDKIQVTGIPVHPSFWQRHNRVEIRERYGLRKMPTALIMGGGWGLLGDESFMQQLVKWRDSVQLIFCFGRNDKAKQHAEADSRFRHENVRLLGFTKEIDKLMEVSHLLVTKPGGITCSEGLAKGIPMLFYKPIPGQEEDNMNYFLEQGFGELIDSPATIDRRFQQMLSEYQTDNFVDEDRPSKRNDEIGQYPPADYCEAIMGLLRLQEARG